MARYRKERLAGSIQQIVSEVIARDLQDPRVSTLTTVNRVELSGDLLQARVYISVFGETAKEGTTLQAMRHARGFIQNAVARQLNIRQCPHIEILLDEGVRQARETLRLLDEAKRRSPHGTSEFPDSTTEENEGLTQPDASSQEGSDR